MELEDIFADVVNVLLFNGEQVILPNSLKNGLTKSQYKADDNKIHEQERDVIKFWEDGGINIAIFGLENQTKIDKDMPLRVLNYLTQEQINMFQSDFKYVADLFVQKRINKNYVVKDGIVQHADEVLKLMSILTGDERYKKSITNLKNGGKPVNMRDIIIDNFIEQGVEQGIEKGIEQGIEKFIETLRELGHNDSVIKSKLIEKYDLSEANANKYLK